MKTNKILIIGKIPPPIGGVTMHTVRLLEYLEKEKIDFEFYNNQNFNILTLIKAIVKAKKAHLHLNNPFFLFSFVLLCRLFNTYSIITIHGNIFSYGIFLSIFEKIAIQLCNCPIVLNEKSYEIANKINSKSKLISAFIPPIKEEIINENLQKKINFVKKICDFVYCTNAYSLVYDKNGNEIYGIISLVFFFNQHPKLGLIISDPKGEYAIFFKTNKINIGDNIILLTQNHSFFEVLKQVHCFIRNTSTDGDSLSIKEALFCGTSVIASDCVSRPLGVSIYGVSTPLTLQAAIFKIRENKIFNTVVKPTNCAIELLKLYNK